MAVEFTVRVGHGVTMVWDGATLNKPTAFIRRVKVAVIKMRHVKNHGSAIRIEIYFKRYCFFNARAKDFQ